MSHWPRLIGSRDLFAEALAGVLSRPHRMILTAVGTLLGVGALVATLGLAATAGNQIVGHFDELAATEVVVTPAEQQGDRQASQDVLPWDAEERLDRLNGVVASGTLSQVDVGDALVRTVLVTDPRAPQSRQVPVYSASPGLLAAVRGTMGPGRWFDDGHSRRGDPVAVIGRALAQTLDVADISRRPAVFIGDRPFTVIGIVEDVRRSPELLSAVIIPDGTARADFGLAAPTSVHIDTKVGAASLIAGQADLALAPQAPNRVSVRQAAEPAATRAKVASDVQALFLILGAVSLLIGGLGIANTTLVSVVERTAEIGLRRALGARRRQVAMLFVTESTLTGLFGGILGAALGVIVTVVVAFAKTWTPVLDGGLVVASPLVGAVIGLVAGLYPAWRAARTEPIAALRTEL